LAITRARAVGCAVGFAETGTHKREREGGCTAQSLVLKNKKVLIRKKRGGNHRERKEKKNERKE
jgi:hypothetical protein